MTNWLNELDQLERDASPGPWDLSCQMDDGSIVGYSIVARTDGCTADQVRSDTAALVALRNHARELIDAARDRDSEERWANQYKAERDHLRALLTESVQPYCWACHEDVELRGHAPRCRVAAALEEK